MPKKRRHNTPRALPVRATQRESGERALEVGGVTQSVAPPELEDVEEMLAAAERGELGYWGLMLPEGCPERALLLGLGGGTVATLLARRCPATRITGVERDATVLALARSDFALDTLPHLEVVEADAFAWVEAQTTGGGDETGATPYLPYLPYAPAPGVAPYDYICIDLFEAGRMTVGTLATPFLRRVAALLAPGGLVTLNLMVTARTPEHLRRLGRVFTLQRVRKLHGNLVLHLTPRPASAPDAGETTENEEQ